MSVISAAQSRAARGLLGWSQSDLARASKVSDKTIADFERGARVPYERTIRDLMAAFEDNGVEFTNGDAPGLRRSATRFFVGQRWMTDDGTLRGEVTEVFDSGRGGVVLVTDGHGAVVDTFRGLRAELMGASLWRVVG